MSTTLAIESFGAANLRERAQLIAAAAEGATSIQVESTNGYVAGDIIYIGLLSRDGCEKAIIDTVTDGTTLALDSALALSHSAYEPIVSVIGDKIRIYRAANVDGTVPDDADFSVLVARDINPEQQSTYYTDADGSSDYWYKFTYYNETSGAETDLDDSAALRGDDYGNYASLTEIRREAGFENAYNLSDTVVAQKRRNAQNEINSALSERYDTPFSPVPEFIATLTIQLAAAMLKYDAFGDRSSKMALEHVRAELASLAEGDGSITDETGADISIGQGVTYDFGEEDRLFTIGDKF